MYLFVNFVFYLVENKVGILSLFSIIFELESWVYDDMSICNKSIVLNEIDFELMGLYSVGLY